MFGFSSNQRSSSTKSWPGDGDDHLVVHDTDGFVLRFESYPEMSAPRPRIDWREGEPVWANDIWGDEVNESALQPGHDDQDYDY